MNAAGVYRHVSTLLDEYLRSLGRTVPAGPLRAMAKLTAGILWTGSVQLTNAARLVARTPGELDHAVRRLSEHPGDRHWDHRQSAAAVPAGQARHVQDDHLIPMDATEWARRYARRMQCVCIIGDASRAGDPLVNGYRHVERFLTRSSPALERMLWCVVPAGRFPKRPSAATEHGRAGGRHAERR